MNVKLLNLKMLNYVNDNKMPKTDDYTELKLFSQATLTCSKLTIETLEQDVKYVQS